MIVELISVGTELLLGNIVNTNAAYLSVKCANLGFSLYHQSVVGDNEERLIESILEALKRSDLLILTGGLGPTKDDLTKEAVAKALGKDLIEDDVAKQNLEDYIQKNNLKDISQNNYKQTTKVEGAQVIYNYNGTAPGLIIEQDMKKVILLPGPPNEMIPMFEQNMLPYLQKLQTSVFFSRMIKICGIGESKVETMIADLIQDQSNPTIAPYAKTGEVHLRITASAKTKEDAQNLVQPVVKEIEKRFGDKIFTIEESVSFEESVINLLKKKGLSLVTAESCTGGLLAGRIVNVAGASMVFPQGFITYSNKSKRKLLGVKKDTLKKYGAVSKQTAKEMAKGAARQTGSDVAIGITGIAGPEGGTKEKPVGLVYISCYYKGKTTVKECHFFGNRAKVRESSVVRALDLLRDCII